MWILTAVADWFDKTREDNDKWIDEGLQPWVASTLYEDSPWYRNAGVYFAAGVLYSVNKLTTTVASGYVDVLRIGDGVKEGGWGYGKDALRLLVVAGPIARGARYAMAIAPAVDFAPSMGNCSWVAAARLLRFTGHRPWAQVESIAKWAGLSAAETGGVFVEELQPALRSLGAATKTAKISSMKDLATVVAENPNAATMFSIEWQMGNKTVAHTLFAVRGAGGGVTIIDRTGHAVKDLAALEKLVPGYGAIGKATFQNVPAVIVQNSNMVKAFGTVPSLLQIAAQGPQGVHADSSPSDSEGPSSPSGAATAPLPPDAQRLYNALPRGNPVNWRQFHQSHKGQFADPYGSLQVLEKRRLATVVRLPGDELNIATVQRRDGPN